MRRLDSVYRNIRMFEVDHDFPSVGSNSSVANDVTTALSFPLGTHVIQWGFGSDATSLQDLILQVAFVDTNTLRMILFNPTAGAVDPGLVTVQLVTGEFNSDLVEPI